MKRIFNIEDEKIALLEKNSKNIINEILEGKLDLYCNFLCGVKQQFEDFSLCVSIDGYENGYNLAVAILDKNKSTVCEVNNFLLEDIFDSLTTVNHTFKFLNECLDRCIEFYNVNSNLNEDELISQCLDKILHEFTQDTPWIPSENIDINLILEVLEESAKDYEEKADIAHDNLTKEYKIFAKRIRKQILALNNLKEKRF